MKNFGKKTYKTALGAMLALSLFCAPATFAGINNASGDQDQSMATLNLGFDGQFGLSGQMGGQVGNAKSFTLGNGSAGFVQDQSQNNLHGLTTTSPNSFVDQGGSGSQFQTMSVGTNKWVGTANVEAFQNGQAGSVVFNSGPTGVAVLGGATNQAMNGSILGNANSGATQCLTQTEGYHQGFQTSKGQTEQFGTLTQSGQQGGSANGCFGNFSANGQQSALAGTKTTYSAGAGVVTANAGQSFVMGQSGQSNHGASGTLDQCLTTGYQQVVNGPTGSVYQAGNQSGFQTLKY